MRKILLTALILILLLPAAAGAAEADPLAQGFIEGYLENISIINPDPQQQPGVQEQIIMVRIKTYEGRRFQLELHPRAALSIDNRSAGLYDFRPGMEMYGKIRGGQLLTLETYSTSQMGYITPGSKTRKGIITAIDRNSITIRTAAGDSGTYYLSPEVITLKEGITVNPDVLYPGDRVKLFFDEVNTDSISRIEIEGQSIIIKGIYRGTLQSFDNIGNAVVLNNVQVFNNGSWQNYSSSLKLPCNYEMLTYIAGQKVPSYNLKYYHGKTVYLVTKNILGREIADRLVIKNQFEAIFNDKIKKVNFYTEALELDDHRNFTFNDGSIIIQDNRLQDKFALNIGDDALIVADGRGKERLASLVYILNQGINNSNLGQHYIYAGRLDQIVEDRVWLEDFYILNENEWESYNDSKELFYDADTGIYDLEDKRYLTVKEFYAGNYAIDEENTQDKKLQDWYAYLYTDGERVVALVAKKNMDSLLRQRISTANIENITNDSQLGWTVNLHQIRDWSSNEEQWMLHSASLRVNLEKAMIIKNDQIITAEELKAGDSVYMVRDDFKALIVIVK